MLAVVVGGGEGGMSGGGGSGLVERMRGYSTARLCHDDVVGFVLSCPGVKCLGREAHAHVIVMTRRGMRTRDKAATLDKELYFIADGPMNLNTLLTCA